MDNNVTMQTRINDTIEVLKTCKEILEDMEPDERYYICRMMARDFAEVDKWSEVKKEEFCWDIKNCE